MRKGFTLIEILIVIALIGILASAISYFTYDSRIPQTNAERLANKIQDTIKNARNNMIIGKGIFSGNILLPTDQRVITIKGGEISTTFAYNNATNTGTETSLKYPFYDNDGQYQITDISVSSGMIINNYSMTWDHTGITDARITIEPNGDLDIRAIKGGMTIGIPINTIRITAGYQGFERSVILDRLTGRSEVLKGREGTDNPLLAPVHGTCDNTTQYACTVGTSSANNPGVCDGLSTWNCTGAGGGSTQSCSKSNPNCPINGSCNNSTQYACARGTPTSMTGNYTGPTCGGSSTWTCRGIFGGSDDISCTKSNNPCVGNSCDITLPSCNGVGCSLVYVPISVNQIWIKDALSCGFNCINGYTGPTCTNLPPVSGFTTTWKVGTPGYGNGDNTVKFNVIRSAGSRIDWGDGTIELLSTNNPSHTYSGPGDYIIKMSNITSFKNLSNSNNNFGKLTAVNDWGGIVWSSMSWMFAYADHLNQLPLGAPNMTNVTDISLMFYLAFIFNQSVANFDTSNVTNMSSMFAGNHLFNQSVANFNTSKVTDMSYMFGAASFNQSVANFDTSKVTNMRGMFGGAASFNQSLANFDTSKVTDIGSMFNGATIFNQPLSNFDTSKAITMDHMFQHAASFNQSVSNFNTSKVTDMRGMFSRAASFNQSVANFDTSNVTNMYQMFMGSAFNQSLANFNTSKVTNMNRMFSFGSAFNQPLTNFDTSKVTDMVAMFANNIVFNQSLSHFDTSLVMDMQGMFQSAKSFNQDISNWCVPLIVSKPSSFDLSGNVGFVGNSGKQPQWGTCPAAAVTGFTTTWKVGVAGYGNGDNMVKFNVIRSAGSRIDWGDGTIESLTSDSPSHSYALSGDYVIKMNGITRFYSYDNNTNYAGKLTEVNDWGGIIWTSMRGMFSRANHLNLLPIGPPNTSRVTDMSMMFYGASVFNQSVSNFDTSNVTDMGLMFQGASIFNQSVSNFNTSKVTNMSYMFAATIFNQSVSNFDTSNVVDMSSMFGSNLAFNQSVSNFDTSNVINMRDMFQGASSFNKPVSNFNTSKVTDTSYMFHAATMFNQPLINFNTSKVINMSFMFQAATNFNQDISNWCVPLIPSKPSFFDQNWNMGFMNNIAKQPQWGTCP